MVEGPLAGGHLGFGMDWAQYDLATIVAEVLHYLKGEQLAIPVIPAGGIFTGSDAVRFMEMGAAGVQVATRFTVTQECGLPDDIKQEYFKANEADIEVNEISPTGYPMRMIKSSPGIGDGIRPNCEAYGYLLDANGKCAYITAYNRELVAHPEERRISVKDKTCLCTHMRNFAIWTCGQTAWRLKNTSLRRPDDSYQLLSADVYKRQGQASRGLMRLGGRHAKTLQVDQAAHTLRTHAGVAHRHVATHAVAQQVDGAADVQGAQHGFQIAQIVGEPVAVRTGCLGEPETAPIGRDDPARGAFGRRQCIDQELEGCAHVHPAVQHQQRGLRRGDQFRAAPLQQVVAQAAHGQLAVACRTVRAVDRAHVGVVGTAASSSRYQATPLASSSQDTSPRHSRWFRHARLSPCLLYTSRCV